MTIEELTALPGRLAALEAEIKALKVAAAGNVKSVYTVKEAAEYMATSTQTVYEWVRTGRLPSFKLSRDSKSYRIYRRDMDALIEILKGESA